MGKDTHLDKLEKFLKSFDSLSQKIDEMDISKEIGKFARQEYGESWREKIPGILRAEMIAFNFLEDYRNSETGRGTYYGPIITFKDKEKGYIEFPSIKDITPSIIDYWEKRAVESKNPILKVRYADLVWEFSNKVKETSPDYKIAIIVIEGIIDIANRDLHKYQVSVITKLKRALSLALSLNNDELTSKVKKTIIAYEDKVAQDDKPGLWGLSFDLLLMNKKIELAPKEKNKVIQDLENRLSRLAKSPDHNFWAVEPAAIRLANYYTHIGDRENTKRVILVYGKVVKEAASTQSSAQIAIAWFERLFHIYMQYGLKKEAEEISIEIRKLGSKAISELNLMEVPINIPTKEIKKLINALIDGDLETALARVAIYYIIRKGETINQLDDLKKKAPIQFLFTRKIQDSSGRIVATVGPIQEDYDGHLVLQSAQNLSISSWFLHKTIEALLGKFNIDAETITKYLYESSIFEKNRRELVKKGIEEYLNKNYVTALHILVPQIEALIRNLDEKTGGAVFKQSHLGGFNYKTLSDILHDENIKITLGEDFVFHLKVLFVDPRGKNLRNNICHGISTSETFNAYSADWVFHSLLCLSLLREQGETNETKKN